MCGFFIAQLVEHRTGVEEVMGSNPVEVLIFSGFFFNWKIYCDDHTSLSSTTAAQNMNYFIYISHKMLYKRVRGWISGRRLPVLNFVKYLTTTTPPPHPPGFFFKILSSGYNSWYYSLLPPLVIRTKPQQLNTMFACGLVLITAVCWRLAFKG